MSIFRCDVVTHISTDEQPCCYIQILERSSYLSYAVRVASSCDDLLALHRGEVDESIERRVLVTTISRQDLHQHCTLVLAPEAEAPLYVAPAAILADKDLLIASAAWLTYFKVLCHSAEGSVEVRVAALPHRVETDGAYFTTLTAQEFAQALPLSRRELNLATCDLSELVESHAQAVTGRPVEHLAPEVVLSDEEEDAEATPAAPSYPPEVVQMLHIKDQQPDEQQPTTQIFESVYVSAEIATRAMQRFVAQGGTVPLSRTLRQKAWLQAALCAIQEYREQRDADQARLALQDKRLRVVLVHGVFQAAHLVRIEPVGESVGDSPLTEVYRGYMVHVEKLVAA